MEVPMLQQVRSLIFAFYLPLITLLMGVLYAPALVISRPKALACVKTYARMILAGERIICGTASRITGSENQPTGPAIIAGKHQSMWETLALISALDKPVYILKQELLNIPIFGWWCQSIGFIGIDRNGGASALREMNRRAEDAMEEGAQLVIFPEGTRVRPGETGRYQPGVASLYTKLAVPCIPFAHNAGFYWEHPGIIHNPGTIIGEFLPAIEPGLHRKSFMEQLENQIEKRSLELAPEIAPASVNLAKMV